MWTLSRRYMAFNYRNRNTTFGLIEESEVKQLGVPVTNMTAQKLFNAISTTKIRVPKWFVNNTVKLWIQKEITDKVFIDSFRFLLEQGLIKIDTLPSGEPRVLTTEEFESIPEPKGIPPISTNTIFRVIIDGTPFDRTFIIAGLTGSEVTLIDSTSFDQRVLLTNVGDGNTTEAVTHTAQQVIDIIKAFIVLIGQDDKKVDDTMVEVTLAHFQIKDGKLLGDIDFIATPTFNSFYYNTPLTSFLQIKDFVTKTVLTVKPNEIKFWETEKDERINYIQGVGNFKKVTLEVFVKLANDPSKIFSKVKTVNIQELPPDTPDCEEGFHLVNGMCEPDNPPTPSSPTILTKLLGGVAILGSIALLATRRR